jgi:gluconokinase
MSMDGSATRHAVVMGVAGCGKTTVAAGLSATLGLTFADADDFHPQANIDKMSAGEPLTDADRAPWLQTLAAWMREQGQAGTSTVLACSALRRSYRDILRHGPAWVPFIHLAGPMELVHARMRSREDHFMPLDLLKSQYATLQPLEADEDGVTLDLSASVQDLVRQGADWLNARA